MFRHGLVVLGTMGGVLNRSVSLCFITFSCESRVEASAKLLLVRFFGTLSFGAAS